MKSSYSVHTHPKSCMQKIYLSIMFFFVGRAIQATANVDKQVAQEFASLKPEFLLCMKVEPNGPGFYVEKIASGKVKYRGRRIQAGETADLTMAFKTLDAAMRVFTFRESTVRAACANRLRLSGEIPEGCAVVRILNAVEVYLLPKFVAKLAVRRYPSSKELPHWRKHSRRLQIYVRTILGL